MAVVDPRHDIRHRPGLPLDPLLQLGMGEFRTIGVVTWTGGTRDPVAVANPLRVALYLVPLSGSGNYVVGPAGNDVFKPAGWTADALPNVIHCRDYPGMVQGEWIGSGMVGTSISVYEYVLSE